MLELNAFDWLPFLIGIQIGPRIRVGGSVGKIGQQLKVGAGKVLKKVAPVATLIPGVGPLAAAGLAAAGTAMDTSKGRVGLGDLAGAGVKSYGLSRAAGLLTKVPGVSAIGKKLGGLPGVGRAGEFLRGARDRIGGALPDGMNSINDIPGYDRAKQMVLGGGGGGGGEGGMSMMDKILLGGTIAAGAEDALHRRGLQNRAEDYAVGSYESRSPLRSRALAMLEKDVRPDHTGMFVDPGNVYDTQRRLPARSVAQ